MLKTNLIARNGECLESLQEVYRSLQEVRVVMAARDEISPGCRMNVWKFGQNPLRDIPFKVIHGPRVQRLKAGLTEEQMRELRENGVLSL